MEDQKPYTVPHPEIDRRHAYYAKTTCPKSETWFVDGGRCGWAHECERCSDNPDQRPQVYGNPHTEIQPERCDRSGGVVEDRQKHCDCGHCLQCG